MLHCSHEASTGWTRNSWRTSRVKARLDLSAFVGWIVSAGGPAPLLCEPAGSIYHPPPERCRRGRSRVRAERVDATHHRSYAVDPATAPREVPDSEDPDPA